MRPAVSIGNQDFASMRESGVFLVDKTGFIREWWDGADVVTLITRPRRFGKTLNMSMLNCFFSTRYEGRPDLFEGLDIWRDARFRDMQGRWPVISLSFANIKHDTYREARKAMGQLLVDLYSELECLRDEPTMTARDRLFFDSVLPDMDDATAAACLNRLSRYLSSKHGGKKVIVLLDEYDAPLEYAYVHGYWDEMTGFIKSLFNATFKTNPALERAVMTGVTRVSKESVFSDLNNLKVVSTTTDLYETSFGFTEREVADALARFGMADRMGDVRRWYDGFRFGGQRSIYNPWSITQFLKSGRLDAWWANTSSNSLVGKLVREGTADVKVAVEDLLGGGTVATRVDEEVVFGRLHGDEAAIWSLLLAAGYLKIDGVGGEAGDERYELSLTNHEVVLTFRRMVRGWFAVPDAHYNDFMRALLACDVDYMNEYMNTVALATFSSFDTGASPSGRAEPERFYHGFVLGLMVDLRGRYRVTSNRESGLGRYDVMMRPQNGDDPAFVLEFKVRRPRTEAGLEDTVAAALRQIDERGYDAELVAEGIAPERIRHFGFAFEGKRVLIG